MNLDLPNIQPLITFDDNLREVPAQLDALEDAREAAIQRLYVLHHDLEGETMVGILGYLGTVCSVLGRHREAVNALHEAVAMAGVIGQEALVLVNTIRLGEAYKYAGDYKTSEALFRKILDHPETVGFDQYKDFAFQHLGKCMIDQGRPDEAIPILQEALQLRLQKQSPELIVSTKQALKLAVEKCEKMDKQTGNGSSAARSSESPTAGPSDSSS